MRIQIQDGECWYGGAAADGIYQPYAESSYRELHYESNPTPGQIMPLFLSSSGRYLWRKEGFRAAWKEGYIEVPDDVTIGKGGDSLKEAYQEAMRLFFPFRQCELSDRFFREIVYNTWIEYTFRQTQAHILQYADGILAHGYPAGILIIDDGWSDYYGKWTFSAEKFPDPALMLRQLKEMGFAVMLWISPFITPDTVIYRELEQHDLLVRRETGEVFITHWWNGWSALLDITKAEAAEWLYGQLYRLIQMGVDGFKFDGGDSRYCPDRESGFPDTYSEKWASFGERFSFNEYRITCRAGGYSLLQRLSDKDHSWDGNGLGALIPDTLIQNLTGHPYSCPDMIGGGEYLNFLSQETLDQELVVRYAQTACMMPVMQFSAAPWRILDPAHEKQVKNAVAFRRKHLPYLEDAIRVCRETGEPVIRPMEYTFPHQGMEKATDQFMIGDRCLCAPILKKGEHSRPLFLPEGIWNYDGSVLQGNGKPVVLQENGEGPILLIRCEKPVE